MHDLRLPGGGGGGRMKKRSGGKINIYFSGATFQASLPENNILKFILHGTVNLLGLFSDFRRLFWAFRGLF